MKSDLDTLFEWVKRQLQTEGGILRYVVQGASTIIVIQIASFALRYVTQIGLARWMGASQYGEYVFGLSIATILAIPAAMGLPTAVLRFVPQYIQNEKWAFLKGIIYRSWQIILAAGGLIFAIAFGVIHGLEAHGWVQNVPVVLLGAALTPFLAAQNLQLQLTRASEYMVLAYAPSYLLRHFLVLACAAVLAFRATGSLSSTTMLIVTGGVLMAVSMGQLLLWLRKLPDGYRAERPAYKTQKWLVVAWPLLLVAGFNVLLGQSDLFLLGVFRPSEDVGVYNVALKSSVVVTFLLTGVNAVAAPRISKLYGSNEIDQLQKLVTLVAHLSFWPSIFFAIGLVVFREPYLWLFGADFLRADVAMIILILGKLTSAAAGSVAYLLNLTGRQAISSRVFAWSAIINIALNLVLIPYFGIEGAAVASTVTTILWNVWLHIHVSQEIGVTASVFRFPDVSAILQSDVRDG